LRYVFGAFFVAFDEWTLERFAGILCPAFGGNPSRDIKTAKEAGKMTGQKNLCAHIPIALHEKVSAARAEAGLNTNDYVAQVLTEYYAWKENGGTIMARKDDNTRTLAFQIPEELFQRIKAYLDRESKRRGSRLTQRDFVVGLIEAALDEAEREAARTEETAAGQPGQADSQPETNADATNGEPEGAADGEDAEEDDGAESAENAPVEVGEDADSADDSQSPEGN
jgi:hypothetical protein